MQHHPKKFWMPHWPIPRGNRNINLGLNRMTELLSRLNNPHKKLPPVIHVAGTNGKGSTLAYLEAMFHSAGYRCHKYISPHLKCFNERIILANNMITTDMVTQLAEECRLISEDLDMTFFEGITAIAFLGFARVPADVLLLEVGMGGRLDATNVIEQPIASIITSISFDHMEFLGQSLTDIANEKAGILKRDCLAISSWQVNEVMDILLQRTNALNCKKYFCRHNWSFDRNADDTFNVYYDNQIIHLPQPSLYGIHQYINASTAAVTALQLQEQFANLTISHIQYGIKSAKWPARMQLINNGILFTLLPNNIELWLDGAHNEGGVQMLIASLQNMQPQSKIYAIHGRTIHRDMKIFLKHFINVVELVSCIEIMGEPDSENPYNIQNACHELNINAIVSDSIKNAVRDIVFYHTKYYNNSVGRIIICGSLFLAGDVMLANHM